AIWLLAGPANRAAAGWGLLGRAGPWLDKVDPFWLCLGNTWRPGSITRFDVVIFVVAMLSLSSALTILCVKKVRSVAVKQVGESAGPRERIRKGVRRSWLRVPIRLTVKLPGPPLDPNPVLWREWRRRKPSRAARIAWVVFAGTAFVFSMMAVFSPSGGWRNG